MIFQVDENIWRGPQPTTPDEISILKENGIRTIINLREDEETDLIMAMAIKAHFKVYDIEQVAIFPPSKDHCELALSVLSDLENSKVYVHCAQGRDRCGFVIAKYRISQGWTKEAAYKEMKQMGLHWVYYWWGLYL